MKKFNTACAGLLALLILLNSCSIIRPGEIGFRQRLGTIRGGSILSGVRFYNPFTTKIIKMNVRTVEIFDKLPLPTKEGLSVVAEISLLYHVNPTPSLPFTPVRNELPKGDRFE